MISSFLLLFGEKSVYKEYLRLPLAGRGIRADSDGPPVFYSAAPGGGINREGGILFGIDFTDQQFHHGIVWGPIMLFLLVGTGVYLTVRCRVPSGPQIRLYAAQHPGLPVPQDGQGLGGQNLTPFQAVSTALAGTVGTGQHRRRHRGHLRRRTGGGLLDVGVRLFGMMTKYAEIVLAVKYRQVDGDGTHFGGPMYYIEKGTGHKWLAVLFALLAASPASASATSPNPPRSPGPCSPWWACPRCTPASFWPSSPPLWSSAA